MHIKVDFKSLSSQSSKLKVVGNNLEIPGTEFPVLGSPLVRLQISRYQIEILVANNI